MHLERIEWQPPSQLQPAVECFTSTQNLGLPNDLATAEGSHRHKSSNCLASEIRSDRLRQRPISILCERTSSSTLFLIWTVHLFIELEPIRRQAVSLRGPSVDY
ncbi:hypothetical protein KIN20_031324 [Parelaphostrongylus tenuis]|uniref:Uncharacterized protein n=1 Tax=Parelaphostrongylus tenuis TaxID=148309 RepID=A0AAD5R5B7_PARTN|nr:hypothetical protein KIN20_031324 [Parelaphostrongylus tenuis]